MAKKNGYLASLINTPPLIFRFQFNPDILSEKKSYTYKEAPFGNWQFDNAAGGSGLLGTLTGLYTDLKEIGSALSNTHPVQAQQGEPRIFAVDFNLDALNPGDLDGGDHYGGSIAPDLALLRSFMMPSMDLIDTAKFIMSGFRTPPCRCDPPECTFVYGDLSVTCVMTDLNIKITAFAEDGTPVRADISVTLKEQTFSITPIIEFVERNVNIAKSYGRAGYGQDILEVTGLAKL
ncbi:MAG TPA: hypothetical protein VGM88_09315 [Kofleriaceae bacterium]|jgi:hypothetical protein